MKNLEDLGWSKYFIELARSCLGKDFGGSDLTETRLTKFQDYEIWYQLRTGNRETILQVLAVRLTAANLERYRALLSVSYYEPAFIAFVALLDDFRHDLRNNGASEK